MIWLLPFISLSSAVLIRPTVRTNSGIVRGVMHFANWRPVYSYMGIPYATVHQRFQAAKPVTPWDGILEVDDGNTQCAHKKYIPKIPLIPEYDIVVGTEDCLKVNVYTNVPPSSKKALRPVMVFIHGGGFHEGSGGRFVYGPEHFIQHDVILVTLNYRLGVLGFLCLGTENAAGNMGLKDQVEALKWVKENIKAFGGDPENITIFGESAGSVSVMYHILSPMSNYLFKRAIMQSGSATAPWAFQFEPIKLASNLAKQMGKNIEDPDELYYFFMSRNVEELVKTSIPRKPGDIDQSENVFVPCAEKNFTGNAFFTDVPYNIIKKGLYAKVPMIIGFNDAEGYYFLGKENKTTIENIDKFFEASLPRNFEYPLKEEKIKVSNELRTLYFGANKINRDNLVKYEGEHGIIYPVADAINLFVQNSNEPMYAYMFRYSGLLNIIKFASGFFGYPGASHADELFYMFKPKIDDFGNKVENDMITKLTTMWTNFAKYGTPIPNKTSTLPLEWKPMNKEDPILFVIDKQFSTAKLWDSETLQYWNRTYAKYRKTRLED